MASNFFNPYKKQQDAKNLILSHHRKLIEQHFSFLHTRIQDNVLICKGWICSNDYKNEYQIEIRCVAGYEPNCKILEPKDIKPCKEIHMYEDHSLCLHYPKDMKWTSWTPIYEYTIPWVVEWPLYYEIFLENGGHWEGPESPEHFTEEDKNIEEDVAD